MKVHKIFCALSTGWLSAISIVVALAPEAAFSQASFFQGKTITIVQGRDPGGTGDLRVRALVPFLQKYIPGNPTIIMRIYARRRQPQGGQSHFPLIPPRRPDHRQLELGHGFARHTRRIRRPIRYRQVSLPGLAVQHLPLGVCHPQRRRLRHHRQAARRHRRQNRRPVGRLFHL